MTTSKAELLPLPDGWNARILNEWGRANVEANTEALRAEVEAARGRAAENLQRAADAEARAERLAEALRNLLDVSDKFTGDKDEDAETWCAVNDAARAALHPTAAQENDDA